MPLESATYIHDLDPANPAANDALAQADDHMRLIKSALKATFPKIEGKVDVSHTDLNKVPTNITDIEALKTGKVDKAGGEMTGSLTLKTGNLNLLEGKVMEKGGPLVPRGVVVMWSGTAANIPTGWTLCNGQVVDGLQTPDLRDRFIVGAGSGYAAGQTGGAVVASVNTTQNGAHAHTTDAQGTHSHGGGTAGHVLTVDQMPSHAHGPGSGASFQNVQGGPNYQDYGPGGSFVSTNSSTTGYTGGNQAHSHGIYADGSHSHNCTWDGGHVHAVSIDTRSPFFALCFIIKL